MIFWLIRYMYIIKWIFKLLICINCFSSSPELKAQVRFSDRLLSICLSVCKLFTISSSSPEPLAGPISNKLGTKHPWVKGIQVLTNEGSHPFQRGDNNEIVKIHWQNWRVFLSRSTGPITKLGTKNPWVKGIQVYLNKGPCPFPRGDNNEIVKIHWRN